MGQGLSLSVIKLDKLVVLFSLQVEVAVSFEMLLLLYRVDDWTKIIFNSKFTDSNHE